MTPTPLVRGLLDTSILIAYREGVPDAIAFITAVRRAGIPEFSQWSALELLAWCRDAADRNGVRIFLSLSIVHPISAAVSRRASVILDRTPPLVGLTAGDALIAATAQERKFSLYTLDPGRFAAVPGLNTILPY